jgi:5'-deoxynucleotidase YfbR-like HD superfamily hydrolase
MNEYPLLYSKYYPNVIAKLEAIPRTGWLQWGIDSAENVWEHILETRKLAINYKEGLKLSEADLADILAIIEIHDWPEALVGDGVILGDEPNVEVLRKYKKEREMSAMVAICDNGFAGAEILELYKRYHSGLDDNAWLVKELEKLQAVFKAEEYEKLLNKKGLTAEFVHYTKDLIKNDFLKNEFNKVAEGIS